MMEGFLNTKSSLKQGHQTGSPLTPREIEIIRHLATGKTNREIAALLEIGVRTIETHRFNIIRKLGIHTLGELIQYAIREGITTVRGS